MKKMIFIAALCIATLTGCKSIEGMTGKAAQGAPYELIVVTDQPLWEGRAGEALRKVFHAPIPYLMEAEPHFTMMRVPWTSYNNLIADHRNILLIRLDSTVDKAALGTQYNLTAAPQLVATLTAPSADALAEFIASNGGTLLGLFEAAERDRSIAFAERFNQPKHEELIRQMFGIEMHIPKGYVLAQRSDDFVWFRYEFPAASQGFMLYSYPYEGASNITEKSLLEARNKFVRRIPGELPGSHMTTSDFGPLYKNFRLAGRLWFEMRGWWDVAGDTMGGPFVSYTTIDETRNRVLTLDTYVYSPKHPKRNYVRETEHLLHLIHFAQ